MTGREQAAKIAKDMVYAYEVCATMKDLDQCVHMWTKIAEQAINAAVEEDREACAKMLEASGESYAASLIRARCNTYATEMNNNDKNG